MKRFAIINSNTVENIAIADSPLTADWIDLTDIDPQPGSGWAYLAGVFTAPVAATPTPTRTLSKLQYMNLFTDSELAAIYTAAKTVVQVEVWLDKFRVTSEVNLDDPRTISGVQALEAAGLLVTGRAAEILA